MSLSSLPVFRKKDSRRMSTVESNRRRISSYSIFVLCNFLKESSRAMVKVDAKLRILLSFSKVGGIGFVVKQRAPSCTKRTIIFKVVAFLCETFLLRAVKNLVKFEGGSVNPA